MCGFCGFSGEPDNELLEKMGDAIKHRGPDDFGYYRDGKMNFCARRLSILDLTEGSQPAHNEDSSVIVVFNGEIYNYKELIAELKERGHNFYSDHSDSELLVHLYEEYDIHFVDKLNGMFAIALWDCKKDRLLLIRDRMGVKPLFYHYNGNQIIFASEIKSILKHPAYHKKINPAAVYAYFSFQQICSPNTAFHEIFSLRPGNILIFEHQTLRLSSYFHLSFGKICTDSMDTAIQKIRFLLTDAIKIRLNADVEIGAFLSGGLDSGMICALASPFSKQPLRTYSLLHESKNPGNLYHKKDDFYWANKVSEQYHTHHTNVSMTAHDLADQLDATLHAFDQPFAASVSTYFLSKEARKDVKVVLSGDGADELFGSYLPQQLAFPMQNFSKMKKDDIALSDMPNPLLQPFETQKEFLNHLYEFTNGNEILLHYRMLNMTDEEKALFLSDSYFGAYSKDKSTLKQLREIFALSDAKDVLNRSLQYYWNTFLPDQVLSYTDALSMAHGLEIRSPFLDYRLVNYVASLPGSYKIFHGKSKYLLKQAAKDLLPDSLIERKKEGFIPPIHDWLAVELKEYVTDILTPSAISNYPFLKADSILFLLHKYYADPLKNDRLADLIWNFLCFQKWCEQYV